MSNDIKQLIIMFVVFIIGVAYKIWSDKRDKE